ncbi:ABC transporter transmembrane region 2-domain-containing protein [Blastocladiella britannica]|nr:ABC transporter transmembrane region 2-domain-containing protein [Blastocladiella britannica]
MLTSICTAIYMTYARRLMRSLDPRDLAPSSVTTKDAAKDPEAAKRATKERVGVNAKFVAQMKKLLPILIPGIASKEAAMLGALSLVLFARTWLDVWFSGLNSTVVKAIVSRNRTAFIAHAVTEFGAMMWVLSVVNNSLKLCISNIALSFRTRLTRHAHEQYLRGLTFYKATTIDQRLANIDQLLTQDIEKMCDSASHLISDTLKPIVDIALFGYKLGQAIGTEAPFAMISYFLFSGVVLRSLSPPFGKYTAIEQSLEGQFRYAHSRLIAHNEEIAFYGGADREKTLVNTAFDRIVRHESRVINLRFANGIVDSVFVKYLATMLAYTLLARPVFDPSKATARMGIASADPTKIMSDYSRNSSYLVNLSQAVGRVILAGRDLTRFAGYTSRVSELFDVLDDINHGRYEAQMVGSEGSQGQSTQVTSADLKGHVVNKSGVIEFDRVPIITPNGDTLVRELSFKVTSGQNTLITGPNGCGKSSLFRILGDLWPLFGGTVTKPTAEGLFYVPQKPYLALGTLRDQVIYPHTRSQALARGFDDTKILGLLETVRLSYLVQREGGFDAVHDWASALSGGEKQRVGFARLVYHKPQFAILDECTSAVSVDVEGIMYTAARDLGISLFTVSHRTSLQKFHEFVLKFDGEGGYSFEKMVHHADGSTTVVGAGTDPMAFGHGKSKYSAAETAAAAATAASLAARGRSASRSPTRESAKQ